MRKLKKALALLTALALALGTLYFPALAAETVASGECGDNLTWTLDDEGTLTISGEGEMEDYGQHGAPWYDYRDEITSVVLPDGLTSIGDGAFFECTSLTSVTIPEGVTYIGAESFSRCTSLTSIDVSEENQTYASQDGVLYSKDGTELIAYPGGKVGAFVIPDGVTSIWVYAFFGCTGLTSVTIPDGVTRIGEGAFSRTSLTSITIPASVTSIGDGALGGVDTIYGYSGTAAEKYAEFFGVTFVALDEVDTPDEPDEPTDPDTPDEPDEPDTPDEPDEPTDPDTPDEPDAPVEPDTPDEPDTPVEPDTPDEPDAPVEPDTPDVSGEGTEQQPSEDPETTEQGASSETSAPKTGDSANTALWAAVLSLSAAGAGAVFARKRKI